MIVWVIENAYKRRECYKAERVYDELVDNFGINGVDDFEAIEAESWCELAVVGEVYYGEGFTITVEEE